MQCKMIISKCSSKPSKITHNLFLMTFQVLCCEIMSIQWLTNKQMVKYLDFTYHHLFFHAESCSFWHNFSTVELCLIQKQALFIFNFSKLLLEERQNVSYTPPLHSKDPILYCSFGTTLDIIIIINIIVRFRKCSTTNTSITLFWKCIQTCMGILA